MSTSAAATCTLLPETQRVADLHQEETEGVCGASPARKPRDREHLREVQNLLQRRRHQAQGALREASGEVPRGVRRAAGRPQQAVSTADALLHAVERQ